MTGLNLRTYRVASCSDAMDQGIFEHIFCALFPREEELRTLTLEYLLLEDFNTGVGVLGLMGPLKNDPATIVPALYRAMGRIFRADQSVRRLVRRQGLEPLLALLEAGDLSEDAHRLWCKRLSAMRNTLRMKRNALEQKVEPTFCDRDRLLGIYRRLHLVVGMEDILMILYPLRKLDEDDYGIRYDEMLKGYQRVMEAGKAPYVPVRYPRGSFYWQTFLAASDFRLSRRLYAWAIRKVVRVFLREYETPPERFRWN